MGRRLPEVLIITGSLEEVSCMENETRRTDWQARGWLDWEDRGNTLGRGHRALWETYQDGIMEVS